LAEAKEAEVISLGASYQAVRRRHKARLARIALAAEPRDLMAELEASLAGPSNSPMFNLLVASVEAAERKKLDEAQSGTRA